MLACKKQQPPEPIVEPPPKNIPAAPSQVTRTNHYNDTEFPTCLF